jgi:gluconolactonase
MRHANGMLAPWMAGVTFGAPDLRTLYPGSIRGEKIPCFRAPVSDRP